jgi:gamma-butyrobetaine dioxygenase
VPGGEATRALRGLPAVWLRDNCPCGACRDPRTGERLGTVTSLPADVSVEAVTRSGDRVEVIFGPDGHRSVFGAGWLSQFGIPDAAADAAAEAGPRLGAAGRAGGRPFAPGFAGPPAAQDWRAEDAKRLWAAAEIATDFAQGSWPLFLAQPAHREACLAAVLRDGFVLLTGVPCEPGAVLGVAQGFGAARDGETGLLLDIKVAASPASRAFTPLAWAPSTAQPFRDPAPTLKLKHCLSNPADGGDSTLVDGFRAAALLRDRDPAAFAALTSTPVTFGYSDARAELRATTPLIGTDPHARVREIRVSHHTMQPLRLPPAQIVSFYAAYRAFASLISDGDLALAFKLRPGDCLVLDNTRILNGRTGFPSGAYRHLQVCWADLDSVASRLALLRRARQNGKQRP